MSSSQLLQSDLQDLLPKKSKLGIFFSILPLVNQMTEINFNIVLLKKWCTEAKFLLVTIIIYSTSKEPV